MLASQIITDVRRELLETTAQYWSDDELIRYINRAQVDFANKSRILENHTTITLTQGNIYYTLPADFMSMRAVFHKIPSDNTTYMYKRIYPFNLEKAAQQAPNFMNVTTDNQGRPTRYFIWEHKLWLNKAPDAQYNTEIIIFYKAKAPTIVTANDPLAFDDELCDAIRAFVLWQAWKKEQEEDLAATQQQEYDRYVFEARKWQKRQSGDIRNRLDIDSAQSLDGNFFPFGPMTD